MFFLKHVLWHVKLCVEHHLNQLILFELFVLTAAPCGPGNALQICGCSFLGWVGLGKHWEVCACCPDAETAVILIWIMCELKNELLSLPVTVVRLHACELSPKTATVSAYIDDSMVPWSASMLIAVANLSHLQLAERSAVLRMAMVKAPLPQRMKHVWKEGVIWCSQIWWCSGERKHRMIPTLKMGKVSSESRRCWKAIFAPVLEIAGRMSILMLSTKFVLRFGASPKRHKMLSSGASRPWVFQKRWAMMKRAAIRPQMKLTAVHLNLKMMDRIHQVQAVLEESMWTIGTYKVGRGFKNIIGFVSNIQCDQSHSQSIWW